MAKKEFNDDVFNQSPDVDVQAFDDAVFETGGLTPTGKRITGKPIDINNLRADVSQPRRTIPPSLRSGWDGSCRS